jgi:hypothetical protein
MSDPTMPNNPDTLVIVVNCLWCISITISLCASIYAMTLKWWLTEYRWWRKPCLWPPPRLPASRAVRGIRAVEHCSYRFPPSTPPLLCHLVPHGWHHIRLATKQGRDDRLFDHGWDFLHRIPHVVRLPLRAEPFPFQLSDINLLSTLRGHWKGPYPYRGRFCTPMLLHPPLRGWYDHVPVHSNCLPARELSIIGTCKPRQPPGRRRAHLGHCTPQLPG